ncbi:MAG: FG-GAP-like repeat-containing protein, partial [Pseudomonadota bacterium]
AFSETFWSGIELDSDEADSLQTLDYNGDGRTDFVYDDDGQYVILQSRGLDPVLTTPPDGCGPLPPGDCDALAYFDRIVTPLTVSGSNADLFLDADGDGRQDFLNTTIGQFRLHLNGSNGFSANPTDTAPGPNIFISRPLDGPSTGLNLDGDGRADALAYGCSEPPADRPCNSSDPHFFVKVSYRSNGNLTATEFTGAPSTQITGKATPVDINGDGLSDVMYQDGNQFKTLISTGTRFVSATNFNPGITSAQADRLQAIDYNGDGRTDLIYPRTSGGEMWFVAESEGTRYGTAESTGEPSYAATLFADLSGDGLTDLFTDATGGSPSWVLYRQQPMMHDLLGRIEKLRLADETSIFYVPATDGNFYTQGDYQSDYPRHSFGGPLYVVSHFAADTATVTAGGEPGRVFTSYHYANGLVDRHGRGFRGFAEVRALNSNTQTLTINQHAIDFPFNGMLETAEQQIVAGVNLDLSRADLPLTPIEYVGDSEWDICNEQDLGWIPEQCTEDPPNWPPPPVKAPYVPPPDIHNGMLVSRTVNTLATRNSTATGGVLPYVQQANQSLYDLGSGTQYKAVDSDFTYDDWGNPTRIVVTTANGSGGEAHVVDTTNVFENWTGANRWCLARLVRAEVRQTRYTGYSPTAGADANTAAANTNNDPRVSTFDYDPASCQLTAERNEPGTAFETVTQHRYDQYGNEITTTLSGADIDTRVTRTTYDARGQFPIAVQNDLGHVDHYTWDPRFGVRESHTDPNGLIMQWFYDDLGRRTREISPQTNVQRNWLYEWCDASICEAPLAAYRVATVASEVSAAGGVQSIVEHDKLGREVANRTLALGGQYSTVHQAYDPLGRVFATSMPAFGAPQCWSYARFDNLGRVIEQRRPASDAECGAALPAWNASNPLPLYTAITGYSHSGLATTVTYPAIGPNGFRRQETRVNTPNDRLLTVCEGAACTGSALSTQYDYDVYGNTTWVRDDDGNVTRIDYDKLGYKTRVRDPDMGTWIYDHNVLGDLILQEDARGQVLTQRYDTLGRLVARTESEGESRWIYDVAAGAGIGHLAYLQGHDGFAEGFAYDAFGRLAETTRIVDGEAFLVSRSYDAFGRLDVLTYPDLDGGAPLPSVPGTPGTPQAPASNTSGSYTVSWSAASGSVQHYKLFESAPDGGFPDASRTPAYVSETTSFAVTNRPTGTFRYKVQACNAGGCGPESAVSTAVAVDRPLTQAQPPTAPAQSDGNHTVRWSTHPSATHYKLYRSTSPTNFVSAPIYAGSETAHDDTLTSNISIYYAVAACETSAASSCGPLSVASNLVVVSLDPPAAPAAPSISPSPSTGSHSITWDAVSGARVYKLYRSTVPGTFNGAPIAETSGLSASDTPGAFDTWYYALRACAGSDGSACSAVGTERSVDVQPAAPAAPSFSNVQDATVTVNWGAVSGAGRYLLRRNLGGTTVTVYDDAARTFTDTVAVSGTYQYSVRACGGSGNSVCGSWGPWASVTLTVAQPGPPNPPRNVRAASFFVDIGDPITVLWDSPQGGADYYVVQERRDSGPWTTVDDDATALSYTTTRPAGDYDYQIRACADLNPDLCSAYVELLGVIRGACAGGWLGAWAVPMPLRFCRFFAALSSASISATLCSSCRVSAARCSAPGSTIGV